MTQNRRSLLLLALSLCVVAGCGNAPPPKGRVTGKVTIQGKPLTQGDVNLFSAETGIAVRVPLTPEATFVIPDGIELGVYQVTITPPSTGGDGFGQPVPANQASSIPEKYRSQETSDLRIEVKKGDNPLEFDLTSKQE